VKLDVLSALNAELAADRAAVLVADIASGTQRLVHEGEVAGDPLQEGLCMRSSGLVEHQGRLLFRTVQAPDIKLLIVGAVHIRQALAPMARRLDFDMRIIDPRTAFATPEQFSDVPVVDKKPNAVLPRLGLDRYTALTHDPKIDEPALTAALRAECFYIGALGSKKCMRGASSGDSGRLRRGLSCSHPCADRPRHWRGQSGGDRLVHPRRNHRDPASGPKAQPVKFGAVPVEDAVSAVSAHTI
jgi:xanthine dehydrogenase accessory factor